MEMDCTGVHAYKLPYLRATLVWPLLLASGGADEEAGGGGRQQHTCRGVTICPSSSAFALLGRRRRAEEEDDMEEEEEDWIGLDSHLHSFMGQIKSNQAEWCCAAAGPSYVASVGSRCPCTWAWPTTASGPLPPLLSGPVILLRENHGYAVSSMEIISLFFFLFFAIILLIIFLLGTQGLFHCSNRSSIPLKVVPKR